MISEQFLVIRQTTKMWKQFQRNVIIFELDPQYLSIKKEQNLDDLISSKMLLCQTCIRTITQLQFDKHNQSS